jgi:ABC-2 type transport system ATP-binding protein
VFDMMIQVENLTKYFGPVLAVDRVSFEVDKGEIVGFLGPNGAGKTTTMRILTTYLPATSGVARIAGHDVMLESMAARRNIGYLPENVPLYGEMRVEEYLQYRAKVKGVSRSVRQKRLEYCLERCRIREVRRRLCGTLSKGYRQRVGLADAMIHDPAILILDEPTAGLDPIQIRETLFLIRELGEEHTILLSTHILSEVEEVCERVLIIHYGRISAANTLEELESQAVLMLEVRGGKEQIVDMLRSISGIADITTHAVADDVNRFEIVPEQDRDVREPIFHALAKRDLPVRRFELKRRRLEDAFFEVIRQSDPLKEYVTTRTKTGHEASEHIKDVSGKAAIKK